MPREKPDYRDVLERLDAAFPGRELLTKTEAAQWLGVSTETVRRRYDLPGGRILKTTLARAVAGS